MIKKVKNYFQTKRFLKLFSSDENPNWLKIKELFNVSSEEKKARSSTLRREIFEINGEGADNISKRYNNWVPDFRTRSRNELSINPHQVIDNSDFLPVPEESDDRGNLFPGMIFESPCYFTEKMSFNRMLFNTLGILVLSGKYIPNDMLTLKVLGIEDIKGDIYKKMLFKIIKTFDGSDDEKTNTFPVPKSKKIYRPKLQVLEA